MPPPRRRPSSTCRSESHAGNSQGTPGQPVNTLCIGVAGGTGSGKTTVAGEIVRRVGRRRIVTVNQDRYYHDLAPLDEDQRIHHNFDHPSAIEESLLVEHVRLLKSGRSAPLPVYDFTRHVRTAATEVVEPQPVILIEGILILAIPALRELLGLYAFLNESQIRKEIEGVTAVGSQPVYRRIVTPQGSAFGRGLQIALDFDEALFEGTGCFLLGAVLEQFFSKYVSINSFTETVVRTTDRGEIMRWPMRTGRRQLL